MLKRNYNCYTISDSQIEAQFLVGSCHKNQNAMLLKTYQLYLLTCISSCAHDAMQQIFFLVYSTI
jgi:hypothetical protein